MKRKKRVYIIISIVIIYLALIYFLHYSEQGAPGSHIRTVGDAFWYSIVTLTTVGYGDVLPVSREGRAIGVVFLLLSTGLLVTLIGTVVSFLRGEAFPMLLLFFRRSKNWYYFADFSAESDTLAKDILHEDENAVIIYGIRRDEEIETPDYPCMFLNVSPSRIVDQKHGKGKKCTFFFMKENDIGVNMKAIGLHQLPIDVYARTTSGRENMSGNIHFFHSYDCCARSYWRTNPIHTSEKIIVLIGFVHYGEALLERAILTNIISSSQEICYHVFGDASRFLRIHQNLHKIYYINKRVYHHDSIFFHKESWTVHHDILKNADRIIICEDDENLGWDILWKLQRYFVTGGRIDIRTSRAAPGVNYFGTDEEIYTANQIIRTRLNEAAVTMNNLFRESIAAPTLDWDDLDDLLKQSKIAAADHIFLKLRILLQVEKQLELNRESCMLAYNAYSEAKKDPVLLDELRRIEHIRWLHFYYYYNWSYGPKRDDTLRQHPLIRDYDDLSEEEKTHHDFAWELLHGIAYRL